MSCRVQHASLTIGSIFSQLLLKLFKETLKFSVQLCTKEKLHLLFCIDCPGDHIGLSSGFTLLLFCLWAYNVDFWPRKEPLSMKMVMGMAAVGFVVKIWQGVLL